MKPERTFQNFDGYEMVRDVLVTAPAVVEHEYLGTLCNLKYLFQLYLFKSVKAIYISVLKLWSSRRELLTRKPVPGPGSLQNHLIFLTST